MDPVGQACPHFLSLEPDINLNSPNKGLGPTGGVDSLTGVSMEGGATGVAAVNTLPPGLTEEEAEELYSELGKVEEEINTLRQVLLAKERHSADLKRKLGLSPLNELKQNLTKGWQDVQTSNAYVRTTEKLGEWNEKVTGSELYLTASATLDDIAQSEAYKKTSETLSVAGQKTTAAFSTMGTALSRKLGDMSSNYSIRQSISMPTMRNSPTFKSFEDKVGNIKYMVVGPRGNGEAVQSPTETTNPVQDNAPF
ncbi:tumor protein D54 isoform X3 [Salmo salar]|uniref:Tumor protein D54 isoform X3 n=1 Tax=Salmo salar TaxID=8030 RepID=A0A1S3MI82_SALSA|nr:tumor protein D54 isoform X3 [Salmo salar]|eukprot:XP_014002902.1 PREDICTED: tumor protein D54-like isoform X3 [Salmo salar]